MRFNRFLVVVAIGVALAQGVWAQTTDRKQPYGGLRPATDAVTQVPVGTAVNGFPNWSERVIHQWINRARVDPQTDLAGCASCPDRGCYVAQPPLAYSLEHSRASRFHADEMRLQGYFDHDSRCTLVGNIDALFPQSCNGSAACACQGGIVACNPICTGWSQRVALFGGSAGGEIIAGTADPNQAFYLWLHEPTASATCNFTLQNGHRWNILMQQGATGLGVSSGYAVGEFGSGPAVQKVPWAAHYPRQAPSVEIWANWYDAAPPVDAFAVVDGAASAMTLARGTAANGAYRATVNGVGSGCHRYYVVFRSATATYRYPAFGTLGIGPEGSCPDWTPGSARGDFHADLKSDILWRNMGTGANLLWTMNGTNVVSGAYAPTVTATWTLRASGDFNGDSTTDLVWEENATRRIDVWLMNGPTLLSNMSYGAFPPGWQLVAARDSDGDGKDDLLWRSAAGANLIWFMNGAAVCAGQYMPSVDPSWTLGATGDYNGDGKMDLVWRESATGRVDIWMMNGASFMSNVAYAPFPPGWQIAASGDFDGDGKSDVLWRSSAGANLLWIMNGATVTLGRYMPSVDPSWTLVDSGDFDGDGKSDLVWRETATGRIDIWLMNGATLASNRSYSGFTAPWTVADLK